MSQTGEPTFDFVKEVQARHEDRLFQLPGVQGVGIGLENGQYVLHVYVNKFVTPPPVVPANLEGVSVIVITTTPFVLLDGGPQHRQTFTPPVPMGVSTSNNQLCTAGTLGFRVRDPLSGVVGYITNNHVAAAGSNGCHNGAPIGADQFQAGLLDSGCNSPATDVGDLVRFVPVDISQFASNTVDAAFVGSSTTLVSNTIQDLGLPAGPPRNPVLYEFVRKSGRTTDNTLGQVRDVNFTFTPLSNCGFVRFVGQVGIAGAGVFAQGGDSGSPVLSTASQPVGLLFGGSFDGAFGVANPLPSVLVALAVELF